MLACLILIGLVTLFNVSHSDDTQYVGDEVVWVEENLFAGGNTQQPLLLWRTVCLLWNYFMWRGPSPHILLWRKFPKDDYCSNAWFLKMVNIGRQIILDPATAPIQEAILECAKVVYVCFFKLGPPTKQCNRDVMMRAVTIWGQERGKTSGSGRATCE